jgi:hypothetical protein
MSDLLRRGGETGGNAVLPKYFLFWMHLPEFEPVEHVPALSDPHSQPKRIECDWGNGTGDIGTTAGAQEIQKRCIVRLSEGESGGKSADV